MGDTGDGDNLLQRVLEFSFSRYKGEGFEVALYRSLFFLMALLTVYCMTSDIEMPCVRFSTPSCVSAILIGKRFWHPISLKPLSSWTSRNLTLGLVETLLVKGTRVLFRRQGLIVFRVK